MNAQFPHQDPCNCRACREYAERLDLVEALNNPIPQPLADALARSATGFNQPSLKPVSLGAEPFQQYDKQQSAGVL